MLKFALETCCLGEVFTAAAEAKEGANAEKVKDNASDVTKTFLFFIK